MNSMNINTLHPYFAQDLVNLSGLPPIQSSAAAGIVFISIMGMLGAAVVILVASMKHSYNVGSNNHLFLISLCSMDFVLCAFSFVFSLQNITAGGKWVIFPAECIAMGMVVTATVFNSLMSCGLVALDRYLIIVFRIHITPRVARILVAFGWLVNIVIQIVPLFNTVDMHLFGTGDAMLLCTPQYMTHDMVNWSYAGVIGMFLAVACIAYAYLHIIYVVFKVRGSVVPYEQPTSNGGTMQSQDQEKAVSNVGVVSQASTAGGYSALTNSDKKSFFEKLTIIDTYERRLVIQSIGVVALCLLCHVGPHAVKLIYGIMQVADPGLSSDVATCILIVLNAALNSWIVLGMNNRLRTRLFDLFSK